MGHFINFQCPYCGYSEEKVPLGQSRQTGKSLTLFKCEPCRSLGSAWIVKGDKPRCSVCYDENIVLLGDDVSQTDCPKCGETVIIRKLDELWE
ncbi:MAG: hypothetical protein BMS9Abin36_0349 [Gammaproteobacteria bacterium]|nr:MAG: hypothetical protein BMS9Abin36_0349 [Gammaproteobacteria bacterium]